MASARERLPLQLLYLAYLTRTIEPSEVGRVRLLNRFHEAEPLLETLPSFIRAKHDRERFYKDRT